jgi:hypothetical protein
MSQELIIEHIDFESIQNEIITEELSEGVSSKKFYITGPYLESDVKNGNGRIYPKPVIEKEVTRLNSSKIPQNRFLGELNHPDHIEVNLERVSHLIKELKMDNNIAVGKSLVLDTPCGKIVQSLIEGGVKLGISSRGVGTLKESIVQADFALHAIDVVSDPSGPSCFMSAVFEGKEWVMENGILTEKQREEIIKEVDKVIIEHQFSVADKQAAFMKLFQESLQAIAKKHK